MNIETYNKITGFCNKWLIKCLHGRHLEDLIQFVAMQHFETKGKKPWKWSCCDYCRVNGISLERGKMGARALESSLSIDAPGRNEESEDSNYLLDQESISRSEQKARTIDQEDSFKGVLEEFLSPLKLSIRTTRWILQSCKVKTN